MYEMINYRGRYIHICLMRARLISGLIPTCFDLAKDSRRLIYGFIPRCFHLAKDSRRLIYGLIPRCFHLANACM
jgi:hypothetical protein